MDSGERVGPVSVGDVEGRRLSHEGNSQDANTDLDEYSRHYIKCYLVDLIHVTYYLLNLTCNTVD